LGVDLLEIKLVRVMFCKCCATKNSTECDQAAIKPAAPTFGGGKFFFTYVFLVQKPWCYAIGALKRGLAFAINAPDKLDKCTKALRAG
jgi:hypothetical protein